MKDSLVNEEIKEKNKFKKVNDNAKQQEKEIKKMNNKKGKNKIVITLVVIAIIVVIALIFSTIFAFLNINNEKIISGISISGIEVSGLTKEEAKAKLETVYQEKTEKEIHLKYEEYESSLNPTLMEVKYDVETAVNEAIKTGKEGNIFINNYSILKTLILKKDISVNMTLNEEVTKQSIEDMGVNLPGGLIESTYSVEENELIISNGKEGVCVDTENVLKLVKENLNDLNAKDDYLQIPVVVKQPQAIDIDKIYEEVHKEAKDAYYTKNPFTIYPEEDGVDFDLEAAKALLQEDKEEYVIKLNITKAKVTISQIGSEAFPYQISTFNTRYDPSDVNRTTNLKIACQKINGQVLLPGEIFSYNKALGPRTAAAGYKNGKIYENGQVVDGLGGGICQISSTLYNSVLLGNLEIVERRNHQFVTSYVGAGRDATVVYGLTDFRFKNTRQYPVKITASLNNGIATVSLYGIKEENEYTFKFSTKTVATIPATTKYVEDNTLPVGTEEVKQKGANGIKTETYITKILNGKVISTELLSKDTYNAMTKIVLKGTKGASTNNTQTKAPEKTETNTNTNTTPTSTTPTTNTVNTNSSATNTSTQNQTGNKTNTQAVNTNTTNSSAE